MGVYLKPKTGTHFLACLLVDGFDVVTFTKAEEIVAQPLPKTPDPDLRCIVCVVRNDGFDACGWLWGPTEYQRATQPYLNGRDKRLLYLLQGKWSMIEPLLDEKMTQQHWDKICYRRLSHES